MARYTGDFKAFGQWAAKEFPDESYRLSRLFLSAVAMRLHSILDSLTPVDTGYLRLSLSARLNDSGGYAPSPRSARAIAMQYATAWGQADAESLAAMKAFAPGDVLAIGYTADYAPYVEGAGWPSMRSLDQ